MTFKSGDRALLIPHPADRSEPPLLKYHGTEVTIEQRHDTVYLVRGFDGYVFRASIRVLQRAPGSYLDHLTASKWNDCPWQPQKEPIHAKA